MRTLLLAVFLLAVDPLGAQTLLQAEAQLTASSGDHAPLWLNANRYGLSSTEPTNGYVRLGLFHRMDDDSLRRVAFGYGADVALAYHFSSTWVVQQAYGEMRWLRGVLTLGSKEQPVELRDAHLSTGPQTLGANARPVPQVRVTLPDYWDIPFTKGFLGIKGHVGFGMQTDDRWQKEFTHETSKHTEHTLVHTKAGYLRFGKQEKPVTVELGLEMGCQFGGKSHQFEGGRQVVIDNDVSFDAFLHAFVPAGGDSGEGAYKNKEGNHLGSYVVRVNVEQPSFGVSLYGDHFFEDSSQMLFLEFDGYGEGEKWDEWEHNRWFIYDLRDMMLGAEVRLKHSRWVSTIVGEYVYSKHQSGPVYHDRTPSLSDHVGGRDNYYNHYIHTGWQHWGQVMGNPLYLSPAYNSDGAIEVRNNRFVAWHLGISGQPLPTLDYRILATWQKGYGTYEVPAAAPAISRYFLAEASYRFPSSSRLSGWRITAAFGLDHGRWTGNNTGTQLTLARQIKL